MGFVAKGIGSLLGINSPGIPPIPAPPPPPPMINQPQVDAAAANATAQGQARAGVGSTIATSPTGVNQPASTATKTLIGS